MRIPLPLFITAMSLSLAGCFGDGDEPSPPKDNVSTAIEETILPDGVNVNTDFRPYWDPLNGLVPYPNDILGFLANIPLNSMLIYGRWGAPELGAAGCGWATAISMWLSPGWIS